MLFTRCPDCGTTFRVTDDALTKANGQVRCGRCASVFNAYTERRDAPSDLAAAQPEPERPPSSRGNPAAITGESPAPRPAPQPARMPPPGAHAATSVPARAEAPPAPRELAAPVQRESTATRSPSPEAQRLPQRETPRAAASGSSSAATLEKAVRASVSAPVPAETDGGALAYESADFGTLSVADVVAEAGLGTADYPDADDGEGSADAYAEPISPSQVQEVLETDDLAVWLLEREAPSRLARWWKTGTIAALVVLVLQVIHHHRANLVNRTAIGPMVESAYATLGVTIVPHWDLRQYEILDWVATAEPNTRGQGSLKITAHIKNRGPQYQPYPSVHLQLRDRWEAAVGSRVFAPQEYLTATPPNLMAPGETARAEIEVVDPGPDAYGFELDVCIEVETHQLSCGRDKVFL